jgi:metal-responsive CopG/Arc/MetJ family transcriptional regulator
MKTIAITIHPTMLNALDDLRNHRGKSRSECVREAIAVYLTSAYRQKEESREDLIIRKHAKRLNH